MESASLAAARRGGSVVVTARGDLDIAVSAELDECLTRAGLEGNQVVVDLSGADFLDTSALAVIIGHWKKARAAGGSLVLAGARYQYTKTLWITGLAGKLGLYETVDQAVAAQAASGQPRQADAQL